MLNASGCLDALTAPESRDQLDAFVTKTITPLPREGNPPPRIAETAHGMLNSIGLQGPGIERSWPTTCHGSRLGVPLWVSVGGFSAATSRCCERLDARTTVATIELNLSCPNVDEAPESRPRSWPLHGRRREDALREAFARDARTSPRRAGRRCRGRRRALAREHHPRAGARPGTLAAAGAAVGGYSGPALKPIALACVYACAQAVDLPIVGMGGVATGLDALELVAAGASAVALGTILFADPGAPTRIRAELEGRSRRPRVRRAGDARWSAVVKLEKPANLRIVTA